MEPRRPPPPSREAPSRRDGARPDGPPPAFCPCRRWRSGGPPTSHSRYDGGRPRRRHLRSDHGDPPDRGRGAADRGRPIPAGCHGADQRRRVAGHQRDGLAGDGTDDPRRTDRHETGRLRSRFAHRWSGLGGDGTDGPRRTDRHATGRHHRRRGGPGPRPDHVLPAGAVRRRRRCAVRSRSHQVVRTVVRRRRADPSRSQCDGPRCRGARPPESGLDVGRRPRSLSPARPSRPWAWGRGGRPVPSRRGRRSSPGEGAMVGTSLAPDATKARRRRSGPGPRVETGGVLLSQGVYPQVPSALTIFTSVFGMGTGVSSSLSPPDRAAPPMTAGASRSSSTPKRARANITPSPRPISTGRLNTLPCLHLRPINVVIDHGPYLVDPVGALISEQASRLDAFSGYPFRRSQTSHAPGGTTGTRELRPSRSSRTRDGLLQSSYGDRG